MEKKFYYSDNPEEETKLIEELGMPDEEYDNAMKKCLTVDYKKKTTQELLEIVKPLEPEGYFAGKTREFIVSFILFQRDRNRDAGQELLDVEVHTVNR